MTTALRLDARPDRAARSLSLLPRSRYTVLGKLRSQGRAELSLCLPAGAQQVESVVLVKTFAAGALDAARVLPEELELAPRLRHDNIVRTLGVGCENGSHFLVSEYLEGVTLARLLEWLSARAERLDNPAVARILLAVLGAVEHAHVAAPSPRTRALAHQTVAAEDVFITCQGDVKLLGFKPARRRGGEAAAGAIPHAAIPHAAIPHAAIDAIARTQRTPELGAVLAKVAARPSPTSMLGLWQVERALHVWQTKELASDGRAELACVMGRLLPDGRAARRAHLDVACARVQRLPRHLPPGPLDGASRGAAELVDEAPPMSGYRTLSWG